MLKQSVLLAREKYEADKVLEVGNKIKELKRTHEWFLELASHSPAMHELFLNAHQNSTLMPLVQEDKSLIHFLVLHEKHEEYQIKVHNACFAF
jgi:hypothetical protein